MANYLYNGVELPELPSGPYPYWYIDLAANPYVDGETVYILNNSQYPLYKVAKEGTSFLFTQRSFKVNYNIADGVWVQRDHVSGNGSTGTPVVWSNFDIYYGDTVEDVGGTIYLPASDPIPVGTLTARDLYKVINGKPTKLTLYKKVGGELVALDEHTKEVKT